MPSIPPGSSLAAAPAPCILSPAQPWICAPLALSRVAAAIRPDQSRRFSQACFFLPISSSLQLAGGLVHQTVLPDLLPLSQPRARFPARAFLLPRRALCTQHSPKTRSPLPTPSFLLLTGCWVPNVLPNLLPPPNPWLSSAHRAPCAPGVLPDFLPDLLPLSQPRARFLLLAGCSCTSGRTPW
jgi:hypothetical protein